MSVLATFARVYVDDLDSAIEALGAAGVSGVRLRFGHAAGLQLALVGDVLVLAARAELLEPFRSTDVTVVVDDLDEAMATAQAGGAVITRDPANQAVGRNVTLCFPGGPVVEFVQWDARTRSAAGVPAATRADVAAAAPAATAPPASTACVCVRSREATDR